jgi:hypothetical protein
VARVLRLRLIRMGGGLLAQRHVHCGRCRRRDGRAEDMHAPDPSHQAENEQHSSQPPPRTPGHTATPVRLTTNLLSSSMATYRDRPPDER